MKTDTTNAIRESEVMTYLAVATFCLSKAKNETKHGFVADYCENSIREISKGMMIVMEEITDG